MTTLATNTAPGTAVHGGHPAAQNLRQRIRSSVEFRIMAVVLTLLGLWGLAIATVGYPALIVPALCLVPVIFAVLMLITVGK